MIGRLQHGQVRRSASHIERGRDSGIPGYAIKQSLATGGMSTGVFIVKQHRTSKKFVAKQVRADGSHRQRAIAELETLKRIRRGQGLNIMEEYFWNSSRTQITFILEYCDNGTLDDIIQVCRRRRSTISEGFIWHVVLSIAKALAFLHHGVDATRSGSRAVTHWNSVCHLDIKPKNVFLSNSGRSSAGYSVVLGDFGCAVAQSDIYNGLASSRRQQAGTPGWTPPESRYGPGTDIWQLGAVVQVLARLLSLPDMSRLGTRSPVGSVYSSSMNSIVGEMTDREWRRRPDAIELLRIVARYTR